MFQIIGSDGSGRIILKRMTLESAIKKARELIARNYTDVQVLDPRGEVILPKQFDYM